MNVIDRLIPTTLLGRDKTKVMSLAQKLTIIFGLVILSILLPRFLPSGFVPLIFLIPPAFVFLLVILRWSGMRVTVVIAAGMIVPISIGTGSGSSLNAAMLALGGMVGVWVLERIVRLKSWDLNYSTSFLPLICLVIVAVLSFVVGQLPWYTLAAQAPISAQLGGLAIFILSAIAFVWVGNEVKEIRWLELATWTFICVGSIYVIGTIIPPLEPHIQRLFPYGSTGSLFWVWLAAAVFSQMLLNKKLDVRWRVVLGLLLLCILYVSIFKFRSWSSGWVPALSAIFAILWFGRPKIALFVTFFAGVIGIFEAQSFLNNLIWIGDNAYSYSTRFEAWQIVAQIAKVSPILGLGPANYYWYTPLFPIRGYAVQFNSHSQLVDLFAQTGILGLACFIWFFAKVGQLGWKLRLQVPAGFSQAYVLGALGGLVGTIVAAVLGDWVLPFVYNVGFNGFRASVLGWIFLGGLVAMASIYSKNNTVEALYGQTDS